MRALTVRQPWAAFISLGWKLIENRTWQPPASLMGERFAIHAGVHVPPHRELLDILDEVLPSYRENVPRLGLPVTLRQWGELFEQQRGRVVATAKLGHVHTSPATVLEAQRVWWVGPFGWELDALERVRGGQLSKGMLGLWALPGTGPALSSAHGPDRVGEAAEEGRGVVPASSAGPALGHRARRREVPRRG
ncbi:MAG TPA: hypothetical protein VGE37_05285 [Archangium sp.]